MQDNAHIRSSFHVEDDNQYGTQLKTVREYLSRHSASRFMIAVFTGIPIQDVCRHVDTLIKLDLLRVVRKDRCEISGMLGEFLSCNPDLWPKDLQLKLFN